MVWVSTIGMVLGPNLGAVGEVLGEAIGLTTYAATFLLAVVLALVAALIVSAFLRPDPLLVSRELEPESEEVVLSKKRGAIRGIIAEMRENRPARIAVIAIILAQSVMVSIMTMTPVHVVNEGGTVTLVGIVISLHVLGMFALAPVVGMLTDRYGNRFTIAVGGTILLVSLLLGIFLPDDMGWVTASLVLLGVGWSFVNVSASALFTEVITPGDRASLQGGADALSNLFGATATFASGPLMAVTNFSILSLFGVVLLVPLGFVLLRPIR